MLVLGDANAATPDRRDALLAAYRTAVPDVSPTFVALPVTTETLSSD